MNLVPQLNLELQPFNNQQVPLLLHSEKDNMEEKRSFFTVLFFLDIYSMMKVLESRQFSILKNTLLKVTKSKIQDIRRDLSNYMNSFLVNYKRTVNSYNRFYFSFCVNIRYHISSPFQRQLCMPWLIKTVIDYIQSKHRNENEAIYLILSVLFLRIINIFTQAHSRRMILCIGYDAMSVVSMEVMRKCLRISLLSATEWSSGEITNLIQVDAQKLILITSQISSVLMIPLQLGISLYLMYSMIGLSFLIGCTIILIMILFNIFTGKQIIKSQRTLLKDKDERTKIANEIFSSIKFIKINALEDHFLSKVSKARGKEINSIKNRLYYQAVNIFSVWLTPQLILSMTFGLYVYLGHQLNPSTTFAIISLFQILQQPLLQLPIAINSLIEAMLSLKRISKFLDTKDLMTNYTLQQQLMYKMGYFTGTTTSMVLQNQIMILKIKIRGIDDVKEKFKVNQQESPILKNINLKIEPGKFVSIIGDVGSGKTSLLQALLGEMVYIEGNNSPRIKLNGKLAYVSQKPWIQNATVMDNIIFGKQFNQQQYENAIYYSCLTQDLQILINGDQTMIGEKGINLSGGQKAKNQFGQSYLQ
ncbi:unnamed protein product (macronuclear) [Paramecium tetraurelia]|uniref:ABC transmembrane type-1 domain-containing protein n=1 Tax=Paramecium tetraurelia TaxID=5888 RepID=A0BRD0_PARTE|nr:uncharacterized protein GSPATT00031328001 [Paramecium tetraurelia]CAK61097.1 unnamed protein product [Paramecium tetraurelia]|eukprot:XP_001428495.1 hypothetical protein (macronuclear) [Paramecium tetraurelia strain d4-2]